MPTSTLSPALIQIAPTPATLGLPNKFPTWRPNQSRAVMDGINARTRFRGQILSCGAGKSLSNVTQGLLSGRSVYLCATKALQKQALDDFASIGMVDIRGRSNYQCAFGRDHTVTCEDGAHLGCKAHKQGACDYVNHLNAAQASNIPVSNYAYWIAANKYGEGLGQVDTLILDEASASVDEVCNALAIELTNRDLHLLYPLKPPTADEPIEFWKHWAKDLAGVKARSLFASCEAHVKSDGLNASRDLLREYRALRKLTQDLVSIAGLTGRWVVDDITDYSNGTGMHSGYRFDIVWPAAHTEQLLFCGIPRILLTSATLNFKGTDLLGIPRDQLTLTEYPADIDPKRAPITWLKSGARVDGRMTDDAIHMWIARLDQFLRVWQMKGIIHCVSYPRQKDIYRLSSMRSRLLWHNSWNTQAKIDEFRAATVESGKVFISPAITTGYDFADDAARFAIIAKIPMIDTRSKVMKARCDDDKDYADHLAVQKLEQSCGRIVRNEFDWGQVVIIDDHWEWWYPKVLKKGLVSNWFKQQVTRPTGVIPEPRF